MTDRRLPLPARFSFCLQAAGLAWLRPIAMAAVACVAATSAAAAETAPSRAAPSVIIDWSAFDSLGPAPLHTGLAPVTLRAPHERNAATVAPTPMPAPAASVPRQPPHPAASLAMSGLDARPPAPMAAPVVPASLAPALVPGRVSAVRFAAGSADISAAGRRLLNDVADSLAANARLRVRIVAHASGGGDDTAARRLSLVRAVEMRSYLLDKGVEGIRMDVHALGNRNDSGKDSPDRVDVVILDR